MWYVYNKEDSWMCGYPVSSRQEAEAICNENKEMDYCYIG